MTGTLPFSYPGPAGATQYCTQYQYNTCGSLVPPLIAFTSERDGGGGSEVYLMNSDGSTQTRLYANDHKRDGVPSWSPDRSKIAFASDRDDSTNAEIFEIYVMNVDGNGQTRLTNNTADDFWSSWSPDGTKIAFASDRDDSTNAHIYEIYVMNANGSGQTRLTNNADSDIQPSWSPDGTKIAFASYRDGTSEIYVMNADGSVQTRLTNNTASDLEPSWSPDGTKIAFRSGRDGNREIYVMNADGSVPIRLTNNTAFDVEPSWSPDGSKIAFASYRDGNLEIYVMNANGSAATRLTNNTASDFDPSWQRAVPPVANAGLDKTVAAGATVQLDGAGSSDPDGNPLTYQWTQTSGPTVTLSSSTVAAPTFTAPGSAATLVFSLVVNDGTSNSPADTVTITVNAPPTGGGGGGGGGVSADLYLRGSVEPVSAPVGGTITWRLRVLDDKNKGPATGVLVDVALPAGVQVVSTQTDRGPGCVSSGPGTLRCNLDWLSGDVPVGNITIVSNVTQTGELVLSATVAHSGTDPVPADNTLVLKANTPPIAPPPPPPAVVKPMFGTPLTLPKLAVAGKRFVFTLAVRRSDTGAPLTAGTLVADPTVAGKLVKHVESFRAGKVRVSFVLPKAAKGKFLKIKIKITTRAAKSTAKIYAYKVK